MQLEVRQFRDSPESRIAVSVSRKTANILKAISFSDPRGFFKLRSLYALTETERDRLTDRPTDKDKTHREDNMPSRQVWKNNEWQAIFPSSKVLRLCAISREHDSICWLTTPAEAMASGVKTTVCWCGGWRGGWHAFAPLRSADECCKHTAD